MRKTWILLGLCLLLCSKIFAVAPFPAVIEYSYEITNETGYPSSFVIPTTSIRPNVDKITKYEILPIDNEKNSEIYIALFDDTTVAMSGEKLGEKEARDGGSAGERFIRPKKVLNGVVVRQGANTRAIIYFIRE